MNEQEGKNDRKAELLAVREVLSAIYILTNGYILTYFLACIMTYFLTYIMTYFLAYILT